VARHITTLWRCFYLPFEAIGPREAFGVGRQRHGSADQLALDLADLAVDVTLPSAANDDHVPSKPAGAASKPRKRAQRNIGALPKHLPRCEQVIEPETTACPCCQSRLHKIGQDVSEVLDIIPAILRVLRMIRPKYGCRSCEGAVVQAKALPRLIENSMASTALVTHVVVSKFAWFSTLYRQVQILAGHGVHRRFCLLGAQAAYGRCALTPTSRA
jgi:transposase